MRNRLQQILRSQNFRNSFWNLFGTASYPFLVVVTTPFFIKKLGVDQYGIWVLINSITQLMSVLNLGLGDANIKFISRNRALQDYEEIRHTVVSTFSVSLIIFLFSLSIGILTAYLIQAFNLFNIPDYSKTIAMDSVRIAFLLFGLKFIEVVLLSIFQGFERYDYSSFFSFMGRTVTLVVNVIFVYYGATLPIIFASSCVLQFVTIVVEMMYIKRKYVYISFIPAFNQLHLKKIFNFSLWTWLQSAMAIATTQFDKFIVVYFSGLETLSYYSLGSTLQTQIHLLFVSVASWLFPTVSKKNAKNEPLQDLYNNAQTALLTFGFLSIIFFLCFEKIIVTVWLGPEIYAKSIVYIRLFLYYNLFLLLNVVPYFFLNGTDHVKYNTLSEFITKALNIAGMIFLFSLIGAKGLVWGLIFSMMIATPIKIGMTKLYALREKNTFLSIESISCNICLILAFEITSIYFKTVLIIIFLVLYYVLYLQKSSIAINFINAFKRKLPFN